ncbi:MAG TPA: hypothetical protein VGD37_13425, partial [Kofleriaceae bacterium]
MSADAGDGGDQGCIANQALRCDGDTLVRCNNEGMAEVPESCTLGCVASELRCSDVKPSNNLAQFLDLAAAEPGFDFGTTASIDTDSGTVTVDGKPIHVNSAMLSQVAAPVIRVFFVRSLTTTDVSVTGRNALAVVAAGDLRIGGVFAASAVVTTAGAGGYNDGTCQGGQGDLIGNGPFGGCGGGGFGSPG